MGTPDEYDRFDEYDDESEDSGDGDLIRCQSCGKMWGREELSYIDGPFGEAICVCSQCARDMTLCEDSSFED